MTIRRIFIFSILTGRFFYIKFIIPILIYKLVSSIVCIII